MQPKHAFLTLAVLSSTSSIAHAFEFRTPHEMALNTETTIEWVGHPSLGDVEQSVVLMRDDQAVLTLCQGQIAGSGQCSFTLSESDQVQGKGYYLGLRGEDGLTIDISKQFEILGGEEKEEKDEKDEEEDKKKDKKKKDKGKKKHSDGKKMKKARDRDEEEDEEEIEDERHGDKKDKKNRHLHHEDHEEEAYGEDNDEVKDKYDERRVHHHHHKDIDAEEKTKKEGKKKQGRREHKKQFENLRRQVEASLKAQEEALHKANEEALRKAKEEALRKAKEEALRKAKEASERNAASGLPQVPTPEPTLSTIIASPPPAPSSKADLPDSGTSTVPQPAVPTGDVNTMTPTFSILPFPIPIGTDKAETPQPALPTGDANTMTVPPTAQPTATLEPTFSILPFPIPIGTDKAETPQPALPSRDVNTMTVPPTAQPTVTPEPIFSILPLPIPIGTDRVKTMPADPTGVESPLPLPLIPTETPKADDEAKNDGGFEAANVAHKGEKKKAHAKGKHAHHDKKDHSKKVKGDRRVHADEAKEEERQVETAWKTVLEGVKDIGSTASDYFSQLKSFIIGKNKVENENEDDDDDDNASPKAARENVDL
ncbi:hypothetical protein BGZ81_001771 [Podila clonocystis]|nr:hypothetical protein BGZ81_001771 [Podila clonocystis]